VKGKQSRMVKRKYLKVEREERNSWGKGKEKIQTSRDKNKRGGYRFFGDYFLWVQCTSSRPDREGGGSGKKTEWGKVGLESN